MEGVKKYFLGYVSPIRETPIVRVQVRILNAGKKIDSCPSKRAEKGGGVRYRDMSPKKSSFFTPSPYYNSYKGGMKKEGKKVNTASMNQKEE